MENILFGFVALLLVMAVCGSDLVAPLKAAEIPAPVKVQVRDGRVFSGYVDPRTTADRLWLRTERGTASLARSLNWQAITELREITATEAGEPLDLDAVRNDPSRWVWPAAARVAAEVVAAPAIEQTAYETPDSPGPVKRLPPPRVSSIAADARIVNWDGDVEHDGLLVTVVPLDGFGEVLPVDGTVEVELIGEGPGTTSRLWTFPQLARWVEPLHAVDIGPNGTTLRLPFQGTNPEFDLQFGPYGLIHVRLVAAGHGTFETTTPPVTLRPSNPIRDRLQQQTRQRFFPTEQTGIGKYHQ